MNDYFTWWVGGLDGDTAPVSVRYPAVPARADHGSEWHGVDDRADGRAGARVELEAGVPALVLQTGAPGWAVRVNLAFVLGLHRQGRSLG